uniref:Tropomyosin n=1 Tax=Ascaris suum TaxID=6253 RepID=F1LGQ8_ASCSU
MERELVAVGINLKTLEVHEERALQRENSFSDHVHCLQSRIKEAETRAEFAERSVQKLQKEVDRLEDAKELSDNKVKQLQEELDRLLSELNAV